MSKFCKKRSEKGGRRIEKVELYYWRAKISPKDYGTLVSNYLGIIKVDSDDHIFVCHQIEEAMYHYFDKLLKVSADYQTKSDFLFLISNIDSKFSLLSTKFNKSLNAPQIFDKPLHNLWSYYQTNTPRCGSLIFSNKFGSILLVRGFSKNSPWMPPKGKKHFKQQSQINCAIIETQEEVGISLDESIQWESVTVTDANYSSTYVILKNQEIDGHFKPRRQGEISCITRVSLDYLFQMKTCQRSSNNNSDDDTHPEKFKPIVDMLRSIMATKSEILAMPSYNQPECLFVRKLAFNQDTSLLFDYKNYE